MLKPILGLLSVSSLLASCAMPPQTGSTQASAGPSSSAASINTAPADDDDEYETVFVPAPTGSLLGGGAVRVAKRKVTGTDEKALVSHIRRLNAAAGTAAERPHVVAAVSRVTGVTHQQLQAQQDALQLRFGDLCAINAIARGNLSKARQVANMKSRGTSWTEVARANGVNVATVVQVTQNANDLTVNSYTNAAERAKGGQQRLKDLGRPRPNVPPGT